MQLAVRVGIINALGKHNFTVFEKEEEKPKQLAEDEIKRQIEHLRNVFDIGEVDKP